MTKKVEKLGNAVLGARAPHSPAARWLEANGIDIASDTWDLQFRATSAGSRSLQRLSFGAFTEGVKTDIKRFLVESLWGARLSNSWAQETLKILRFGCRFLVERCGPDFTIPSLTAEDAHAFEYYCAASSPIYARERVYMMARLATFVHEFNPEAQRSFRPNAALVPRRKAKPKTYSNGAEQIIPDEVSAALMSAFAQHLAILSERSPYTGKGHVRTEWLYLAVIPLILLSGRRPSEILSLPRDCLRQQTSQEQEAVGEGIWLRYRNSKSQLGLQEVFIPSPGSAIVRQEVLRIQQLTAKISEASQLDFLFLGEMPNGRVWETRTLTVRGFSAWLNGSERLDGRLVHRGFIHRYNILYDGKHYHIQCMQARHTVAHKAYLGGASYQDVGDFLHHKRSHEGLSPITGVYLHGRAREVRHLQEMNHSRLVTGRAVPLIENKDAEIRDLHPSDIAQWQEQGMLVHHTHYGHCIIPDSYGPCVCGDPCYIGPTGDGCDYALYTPESKASLERDKVIWMQQVEQLQQRSPAHPQLGQLHSRVDRIDQVLAEITQAELTRAAGESPQRPRGGLAPVEPEVTPMAQTEQRERTRRQRHRERSANMQSAFKSNPSSSDDGNVVENKNVEKVLRALAKVESADLPVVPEQFALRMRMPLSYVVNIPGVLERLTKHNMNRPLPTLATVRARLAELWDLGQEADYQEFASLYGVQRTWLPRKFPEVAMLVGTHNRAMRAASLHTRVERRVSEICASEQFVRIDALAHELGVEPMRLYRTVPDLVATLRRHNNEIQRAASAVERQATRERIFRMRSQEQSLGHDPNPADLAALCELNPQTVRELCPELVGSGRRRYSAYDKTPDEVVGAAFESLAKTGQRITRVKLARLAGISQSTLYQRFPLWVVRCEEHNQRLEKVRVEQAWERMETSSEGVWTIERFAREAGLNSVTFRSKYHRWAERLKARRANAGAIVTVGRERCEAIVREALRSRTPAMPRKIASDAGIDSRTFQKSPLYADMYQMYMAHVDACYRPQLEEGLQAILTSGERIGVHEFVARVGFESVSALVHYFPDIARVLRVRHKELETVSG